jgi:hypothetical protein
MTSYQNKSSQQMPYASELVQHQNKSSQQMPYASELVQHQNKSSQQIASCLRISATSK